MKLPAKIHLLIPICTGVLALVWIVYGLSNYGFWDSVEGPRAAFVPSLAAVFLLVVSILGVLQARKTTEANVRWENWTILLAAFIIFGLIYIFGMIPSLLLFVFVWLKFYEKESWKNTIIVLLLAFGIAYGCFVLWLKVPFPMGALVEAIYYRYGN